MRAPRTKQVGFSMVELLAVMVVLGLIAGVAAVSWQASIPRAQMNSSVRELSDILHGARADAIARNLEYKIQYDIDNNSYWVETPFSIEGGLAYGDEERAIAFESQLKESVAFNKITVDGEEYFDGIVHVRFDPLGASSDHTVVLHQEIFDRYFTVEVLALTGLVRFHDDFFEREEASDGDFD
ncbi:MAG: prepilin-type N-terminal cleavage/methylation domain-containing protein [Planctomycetota bacterium]|jgi:prepilin-type N-terminal cleavage/methylation domain-containing protein